MKNTKIKDEYDLKLIEENLDKFEHDFKKELDEITEYTKKLDDILKDLTKADWGKMKKFMKKDINLVYEYWKDAFYRKEKIKQYCETLEYSFEELDGCIKKVAESEVGRDEYLDELRKIRDKNHTTYLDYNYKLLPKAVNVMEKANLLWDILTWKSNLTLSIRLNTLTWTIIFFTVILGAISVYLTWFK